MTIGTNRRRVPNKEHAAIDNRVQRAKQLATNLEANGCSQYVALGLATQVVLKQLTEADADRLSKESAKANHV